LLSTTTAPARTATLAHCRDRSAPAEKSATSTPSKPVSSRARTVTGPPPNCSEEPADRGEAKQRSSRTGKRRSAKTRNSSCPTAPAAPPTATRSSAIAPPLGNSPDRRGRALSPVASIDYAAAASRHPAEASSVHVPSLRLQSGLALATVSILVAGCGGEPKH